MYGSWVNMLTLRLCGCPPGVVVSSHSPKTFRSGPLETKLPVGVNVSVYMCVSYVIDWQHVQASHPMHAGMDSSPQ